MDQGEWLSVSQFAARAAIGRRSATAAVSALRWRGHVLEVRKVHGRGGKGGLRFEVSLRSLSEALGRPTSIASPCEPPTSLSDLLALIQPALDHPRGSLARAKAVTLAAQESGQSERTIRRKIADYERGGAVALLRKQPKNAGKARVIVSRAFTEAFLDAGGTAEQGAAIQADLTQYVRAYWASQAANAGAKVIAQLASKRFAVILTAHGLQLDPAAARRVLKVPRRLVEAQREYSALNRKRTDAKKHYDARPGVLRDWNACGPMEVVMGDVHPFDVRMRRRDGEPAFAVKILAFMDVGTRRVWAKFINVDKGCGVKQEHVAATFAAMATHPQYGMPGVIYLDNGSEFGCFEPFVEAYRLMKGEGYKTGLIHAKPYNARGKSPLESFFGHFERGWGSLLPGYAGGDRQRQKTANQGKEVEPADWSVEYGESVLNALMSSYNSAPHGELGGLSPNEAFQAKVRYGWQPTTVSIEALAYGFARRHEATPRQGIVQFKNEKFRLPPGMRTATKVLLLTAPFITGGVLVQHNNSLVLAEPAKKRHPLDPEGAREAYELGRDFDKEVDALGNGLPSVTPWAEIVSEHLPSIDVLEQHKPALRQAISPKARREEVSREEAERKACNAKQAEAIARFLPNSSKVA